MSTEDPQAQATWSQLSQAERDAAYNNRGAIAGADDLIAARKVASAQVRADFPCHCDVAYGNHPRECWDIFPARNADAPCLVFIHGGYWQGGARDEFSACIRAALEKGWSAALCGYPLAPEASLSDVVGSVARAMAWLDANREGFGAGGPLVISGWSAGAHLAALNANHPSVRAVLCISGIFELAPLRDTFLNAKLELTDAEIENLSPVRLAPVDKPFIVAFGDEELPEIQRQSQAFFAMRAGAGVPGELLPITGANHLTILEEFARTGSVLAEAPGAALSLATTA